MTYDKINIRSVINVFSNGQSNVFYGELLSMTKLTVCRPSFLFPLSVATENFLQIDRIYHYQFELSGNSIEPSAKVIGSAVCCYVIELQTIETIEAIVTSIFSLYRTMHIGSWKSVVFNLLSRCPFSCYILTKSMEERKHYRHHY